MTALNNPEFLHADFSKQYIANGLSHIPGGFFVYKAHGNKELLYANHELLSIFECDTAEQFLNLTGGTFRGLVHPDDISAAEMSIKKQLESDVDHLDHLYYRIITRTGKIKSIVEFGRMYRGRSVLCVYRRRPVQAANHRHRQTNRPAGHAQFRGKQRDDAASRKQRRSGRQAVADLL